MTSGRDTYCADCGCYLVGDSSGDLDTICQACNITQELAANRILDRAAEVLRPALNKRNRAKLDAMTPQHRRTVAGKALADGHLKWRIS
jgi:hypothetical protein